MSINWSVKVGWNMSNWRGGRNAVVKNNNEKMKPKGRKKKKKTNERKYNNDVPKGFF